MQNKNTDQALQIALKLKPDMTLAEFNEMQAQPLSEMQTKGRYASRTKLILGVGIIIVAWIIVAVFSVVQIVYANDMYTNIFDGEVSRMITSYQAQSETRALRQILTASVMHAYITNETERQNALNSLMTEAQQVRTNLFFVLDDYDLSVRIDPMQTQAWVHARLVVTHNLRQLVELIFNQYLHEVFNYALVGDYDRVRNVFSESTIVFFSLTNIVNYLIEISDNSMQHALFHTHDKINTTMMTIAVIMVVAIISSIIVTVILLLPKRNNEESYL